MLKDTCEELESVLKSVLRAVEKLQSESLGIRGRLRHLVRASNIKDEINGHERRIQGFCSTITLLAVLSTGVKVDQMHTAAFASNPPGTHGIGRTDNCPPPSRIFHGRQAILDKMEQFFTPGLKKQYVYVLHGPGGTGKTQIALKFIQQSTQFTDKLFIDASTTDTIDTSLKNIAHMKHIGVSAHHTMNWLNSRQEEWLLFFDNFDNPKLNLDQFLPKCGYGKIIITTRNSALRIFGGHSPVSCLDKAEAVTLLLTSAGQDPPSDGRITTKIVQTLGCLPLAIVQAGAFILRSGSLDSYLQLYVMIRQDDTFFTSFFANNPSSGYCPWDRDIQPPGQPTTYTAWVIEYNPTGRHITLSDKRNHTTYGGLLPVR
ncbi:P-loop containing nucleoside triphosphate hydrolase protein [Mycena vitilis]|nr:P-loop containing nucleoside triphosphate hydrolase protein [Mycena vitilis]